MFVIAYAFKGQVHVFAGRVKNVSHLSCRTSAILKYFCHLAEKDARLKWVKIDSKYALYQNLMYSNIIVGTLKYWGSNYGVANQFL